MSILLSVIEKKNPQSGGNSGPGLGQVRPRGLGYSTPKATYSLLPTGFLPSFTTSLSYRFDVT